ncbi:phosphoenolpyruvate carboxykinase (ATP) [Oceanobacillus manasiensis]|uniref:phosphoenolpyruvate carboxykinase (ATP) n=1 Tax=Oceanobacillus manasiensis TaxID=586413 RepID=UPI0005A733A7|nr:phosphoenolpyruvate carboxykinase (ATP) [Oceanobacillus manasiensis]
MVENIPCTDLEQHSCIQENASVPRLIDRILAKSEAVLTSNGAVLATTGKYTGRSPKDKFIVRDAVSEEKVDWGPVNQPIDEEVFEKLYNKTMSYLKNQDEIYRFKGFAGADETSRLPIQVVSEYAWHSLFARQLFIAPTKDELTRHKAEFTVLSAPGCKADPVTDGTNSETFIIVSFKKRVILIGGTEYAGEIKKSIFSVMNYLLPERNIMSMHCSANVGDEGDVALFFGLSGTGKTTLSADPYRKLIGDDEHGWSDKGIFNIEGGCYAKCVDLSKEKEPQIYDAIRFGSVLENVILDENDNPDYSNTFLTENTRAAYPIEHMDNTMVPSVAGHPNTIIFLTADASGTLPPISKLSNEQAMYHFLSGYTSKLAGTERGVTEPQATFSACFGSPFLPLSPSVYAEMLGKKIEEHSVNVFLINTGWTGGTYGKGGERIKLSYTRAMVYAALQGELNEVETVLDEIFGLEIPRHVPGVPEDLLVPVNTWDNIADYQEQAEELALKFHRNFEKFTEASTAIKQAGPLYRKTIS